MHNHHKYQTFKKEKNQPHLEQYKVTQMDADSKEKYDLCVTHLQADRTGFRPLLAS